ncbi:GspH/FimT family pseudopilin [Deefgea rivuli]|uniref:GspH/FimT family pseudopilin n=1 Tax=Deefgea rivuli TaxID=400948 RepID=UPI0009FC6BEB|nr:GspH/FimT family pseudopilin [Deefgea rivuli]
MQPSKKSGFTLIEMLVAIAIIGIVLAIAAPSFSQQIASIRTKNAIENISGDLANAKSEAIRINRVIFFHSYVDGNNWCYGYGTSNTALANCNCDTSTNNSCKLKFVTSSNHKNIVLNTSTAFETSLGFEPIRGQPIDTTGAALAKKTMVISNTNGIKGYITVSAVGKIKTCSSSVSGESINGLPKTSSSEC